MMLPDLVENRETFLMFVRELVKDRLDEVEKLKDNPGNPFEAGPNGWENITIEAFLEAAVAWAESKRGLPDAASWQAFAEFLYCGKIYE